MADTSVTPIDEPTRLLALMERGLNVPATRRAVESLNMEREYPTARQRTKHGQQYVLRQVVAGASGRRIRLLRAFVVRTARAGGPSTSQ